MKKGQILIGLGLLLIASAFVLCAYNVYDAHRAGRVAQESVNYLDTQIIPNSPSPAPSPVAPVPENTVPENTVPENPYEEIEIPDYVLNPAMEMPVVSYEGEDYIGILEIPAIDLKIPVISEWNYPRLRIAPCRYFGSAYTNNLVISAHNYASHFGSIHQLPEGAAVIFTDADGNPFHYRVALTETLGPRDVEYMVDSGWDLSLFTCTPGGSYRVTVRCAQVKP